MLRNCEVTIKFFLKRKCFVLYDSQLFRSDNFYKMFLQWKKSGDYFQYNDCMCLNFGVNQDSKLSIPQFAMTTESRTTNVILDFTSHCYFVIIGGKYLDVIGDVMEKVNMVTSDVGGTRPLTVFLISNDKKKLIINLKYGFERYKSTPPMVINE